MTYTFKLARRLAVSRHFTMLPALLLFAACLGGDATAPEGSPAETPTSGTQWRPRDITAVALQVEPSVVTLETNQLIHFRALGRTRTGDSVAAAVVWSTTGGTILPDGRFSAAAIGTYTVIGRTRVRGQLHVDSSLIRVVRRQPKLASVQINPVSSSLTAGSKQTFTAVGHLSNGTAVPIGANWFATGGSVDGGGNYTAGDSAGSFQVIATNTAGTLADTATITVTVPPAPPPPVDSTPAPLPPPTPVVDKVTLIPATANLAASTKRQFAAYGHTTAGDSVAVNVVFTATGGTVTPGGLFTAGTQAGTFRVVATSGTLADTSTVTVTVPLGSADRPGIPFGAFHVPMDSLGSLRLGYNAALKTVWTPTIKSELDKARAHHGSLILAIDRAKTKDATGKLSVDATKAELANWAAAVDLAPYMADGTVIGVYVSDDINSAPHWGGEVPPKARIDSLALAVKTIWPQALTFVRAKPTLLTGYTWRWLTTAWAQYDGPYREGSPESYRATQVATAKALKLGLVLWLNVLDGGCGPTGACPAGVTGTSVLGTFQDAANVKRYQMSASEVAYYGKVFMEEPYNCLAIQWQYSPIYKSSSLPPDQLAGIQAFDTRPDVRAALGDLSIMAAKHPTTSCLQR